MIRGLAFLAAVLGAAPVLGRSELTSDPRCGPASCPPIPVALPFVYRNERAVEAARGELLRSTHYLARASRAARDINQAADMAYIGANLLLNFVGSAGSKKAPTQTGVLGTLADLAREELAEAKRLAVIGAMRKYLNERPDVSKMSMDQKTFLVRQALFESERQADVGATDEMQNEAIRIMLSQVKGLSARQEILAQGVDGALPLSEFLKSERALNERIASLAEGPARSPEPLAGSTAAAAAPASSKVDIADLVRDAEVAAEQMQAAASIAHHLGAPKLGNVLNRGSAVVSLAGAGVRAYLGNPMGLLPAVSGVLGAFGGGSAGPDLSWIADYLDAISKQVEALAEQVQKNHVETMERLDYIAFVAESTRDGVAALLVEGLDSCQDLVPRSWFLDEGDDLQVQRRLNYQLPLVFSHYDEVEAVFTSGRWTRCSDALQDQFSSAQRVGRGLPIDMTRDVDPKVSQSLISIYDTARAIYPSGALADVGYLFVPASYVSDFETANYRQYVADVLDLVNDVLIDPRDRKAHLIDPLATETAASYALVLHGFFDYTGDSQLRQFGSYLRSASPTDADIVLQSALAQVSLAIAQQQMMYGVVREFGPIKKEELQAALEKYFGVVKFAPYQIGRIVYGSLPRSDRWIAELTSSNMNWLRPNLESARLLGQSPTSLSIQAAESISTASGREVTVDYKIEGAKISLVFPFDGFEAQERMVHSEAVQRLGQLQARLVMALRSYRDTEASTDANWLHANTTFLAATAPGSYGATGTPQ